MSDKDPEVRVKLGAKLKEDFQVKCLREGKKMTPVVQMLVDDWTYGASQKETITAFLQALMQGERPANTVIVKVAGVLNLETEELLDFCDHVLSKGKPNGCNNLG